MKSPLHTLLLLACAFVLATATVAAEDDERYVSSNTSSSVRPPVLEESPQFGRPPVITLSELNSFKFWKASDLPRLGQLVDRDAMVVGKVDSVFIPKGENKVILNFGRDFRNCFKAVIDIRDFEKWGTSDPNKIAKMFDGREIAVDGLISLHQGKPQIAVRLPHQLKIVKSR